MASFDDPRSPSTRPATSFSVAEATFETAEHLAVRVLHLADRLCGATATLAGSADKAQCAPPGVFGALGYRSFEVRARVSSALEALDRIESELP